MAKPNAANARIKREYFAYLKESQRRDESVSEIWRSGASAAGSHQA
jgi:hypothetical protein